MITEVCLFSSCLAHVQAEFSSSLKLLPCYSRALCWDSSSPSCRLALSLRVLPKCGCGFPNTYLHIAAFMSCFPKEPHLNQCRKVDRCISPPVTPCSRNLWVCGCLVAFMSSACGFGHPDLKQDRDEDLVPVLQVPSRQVRTDVHNNLQTAFSAPSGFGGGIMGNWAARPRPKLP